MSANCMSLQGVKESCTATTPAFVLGIVLAASGEILVVTINQEIREAVTLLKD